MGGPDGSTEQFTFAAVERVAGGGDAGHGCVAGCDHTAHGACSGQVGSGERQSVAPWIHLEPAALHRPDPGDRPLVSAPRARGSSPQGLLVDDCDPHAAGLGAGLRVRAPLLRVQEYGRDAELARASAGRRGAGRGIRLLPDRLPVRATALHLAGRVLDGSLQRGRLPRSGAAYSAAAVLPS